MTRTALTTHLAYAHHSPRHPLMRLGGAFRLALILTLALLTRVASANAVEVPNSTETGSYTVNKVEYYGGSVQMDAPNISGAATAAFQQPLDGSLFYPTGPGPFKFIVLLHGNHADCLTEFYSETTPSSANCASTPGNHPLLNYEGYEYLADNLASHGYIVISVDADALTSWQTSQDDGTYLRDQLLSASLEMAYGWEDGNPLYVQTSPGQVESNPPLYSDPYVLAGHIDLEDGVGLWGHSRGGEAVADFVAYNRIRPAPGHKFKLGAVMSWAPVDYERTAVHGSPTERIPYATVLPLCDGDVSDLHGARIYMNSLHAEPDDPSPKIQFAFQGGDHDYTNTIWASSTSEDGLTYLSTAARPDAACGQDEPHNVRLSAAEQQKLTVALTGAFMRRYLGGETVFEPLMTGEAGLPSAACPNNGLGCGEELKTTYFAPAEERRDILVPEINAAALTEDALGGRLSGTGFQNPYQAEYCVLGKCEPGGTPPPPTTPQGYTWCDPEPIELTAPPGQFPTAAKPCPLPPAGAAGVYDPVAFGGQANERENDPVNRSWGPQLALAWEGPARLNAEIPASDGNESQLKVLAMDVGINYFDSRNPPSGPNDPLAETDPKAAMQNFEVQLSDSEGHTATVEAANPAYGTALQAPLGSARRNLVLDEIRIPLSEFAGVNLERVTRVSLIFGNKTPSGSIELANMRFQEPASPSADPLPLADLPPASTAPSALSEVLPGTSASTSAVIEPAGATSSCGVGGTPVTRLRRLNLAHGRLLLAGRASEPNCDATAAKARAHVVHVLVTLAKLTDGKCRFVKPNGRLGAVRSCAFSGALEARGTSTFRLRLRTHLPPGRYEVDVQGIDSAGTLEKPHGRTFEITKGAIAKVVHR